MRVNALAPGYVETDLTMELVKQGKIDLQALARRTPQGRIAAKEDVAQLATFLASNAASHITGQVIAVMVPAALVGVMVEFEIPGNENIFLGRRFGFGGHKVLIVVEE